jgi:hypothetical protein
VAAAYLFIGLLVAVGREAELVRLMTSGDARVASLGTFLDATSVNVLLGIAWPFAAAAHSAGRLAWGMVLWVVFVAVLVALRQGRNEHDDPLVE